jgi:predicted DNA-binding transcriptional regulator AlpA
MREVSDYTRVPVETLRYWRQTGKGPQSFRMSARRVVYARADVERWIEEQRAAERDRVER